MNMFWKRKDIKDIVDDLLKEVPNMDIYAGTIPGMAAA